MWRVAEGYDKPLVYAGWSTYNVVDGYFHIPTQLVGLDDVRSMLINAGHIELQQTISMSGVSMSSSFSAAPSKSSTALAGISQAVSKAVDNLILYNQILGTNLSLILSLGIDLKILVKN